MRHHIRWAAMAGVVFMALSASAQTSQNAGAKKPASAAASVLPGAAGAADAVKAAQAHASLDRTAAWVGDRMTYTIEVDCPPGVDILGDDLNADKLRLDGLDLSGSDMNRQDMPDGGTKYVFRYFLTSYNVNVPTATIGSVDIRYFVKRVGQRLEDATPAGLTQVPEQVLAIRSLLPDGQKIYPIRDNRAASLRLLRFTLLQPIGLGLVVISFVPALIFLIFVVQRIRIRRHQVSRKQIRVMEQGSMDTVRSKDLSAPESRREAYAALNSLVRGHLHQEWGVPAESLTPSELGPALSASSAKVSPDLVTSVLGECEVALYSPLEQLPSAEACRQTLKYAETVLAAKR